MMSRQRRACAAGSPLPTVLPSRSGAVPDTAMIEPTRTAREMPTIGSYGLPLEMSVRMVQSTFRSRLCTSAFDSVVQLLKVRLLSASEPDERNVDQCGGP